MDFKNRYIMNEDIPGVNGMKEANSSIQYILMLVPEVVMKW